MPSLSVSFLVMICYIGLGQLMATRVVRQRRDVQTEEHETFKEYCLGRDSEMFEAKCLKSEVILMRSAIYGRMRIGRCLKDEGDHLLTALSGDPLFLGCSTDVISLFDQRCSGRTHCEIRGTEEDLLTKKPCIKALPSYLEADYECVSVIEEDRSCKVTVSSNPLHIMRSTSNSSKLSCGTKSQPWRLEAPAGQQINISLLDFGSKTTSGSDQFQILSPCQQYGYVLESATKRNVSICGLDFERKRLVYKSSTNAVDIVMNNAYISDDRNKQGFLFRIMAVGCSDLIPPVDAWLRRTGNEAVVGCYTSRQTWHLRCTGHHWVGVMGNCTLVISDLPLGSLTEIREEVQDVLQQSSRPTAGNYEVMIIVAITCFGIAICLVVVCIGTVCWRRYNAEYQKIKKSRQVDRNGEYWNTNTAVETVKAAAT